MWTIQESYPDQPVLNKQINISLLFILGWGREAGGDEGAVTQSLYLNALWLSAAAVHPALLWLKALLV